MTSPTAGPPAYRATVALLPRVGPIAATDGEPTVTLFILFIFFIFIFAAHQTMGCDGVAARPGHPRCRDGGDE